MNTPLKRKHIDETLAYRNRTLRTLPGKLLFAPTGKRLFADYLDKTPGFAGRIDFIHKLNLPSLFDIRVENRATELETADTVWYPSHLTMDYRDDAVSLHESKFITWDDIALSIQCWTNHSEKPLNLLLDVCDGLQTVRREGIALFTRDCVSHDMVLTGAIASNVPELIETGVFVLAPKQKKTLVLACAVGEATHEMPEDCGRKASAYLKGRDYLEAQRHEYDAWFDDVPVFESDDPLLDTTWWYRWFILRHTYAEPNLGHFHHGVFYEGRAHKTAKEPYAPWGHEFTQLIPMSTPMHVTDARWKHDGTCCRETLKTLLDSMDKDGVFRMMMTDKFSFTFGNYAQWGLYQFFLAHRDEAFILDVLEGFKKNVRGVWDLYRGDEGDLQIAYNHRRPGKEYQPAYWYFEGYPDNASNEASYTWLKRVDLSTYLYVNARGIEKLCSAVNDPEAGAFKDLADRLEEQVLNWMWDEETGFFYDLHFENHQKALVKGVTGIYPIWAGMTDERHLRVLDAYFSEAEFAAGSAFASVTKRCPVYYPQGSWKGQFFKGRDGCMWDGPSWPYTTCIALDAIGEQSKRYAHGFDGQFGRFLREYAWQHYRNKSLNEPYLVEHYNAETGEMLSDDVDYSHSFFIDLIVKHVAGLAPTEHGFTVDPIDVGLSRFSLTNVVLNGLEISIHYQKEAAFEVFIDQKLVHHSAGLEAFSWEVKE